MGFSVNKITIVGNLGRDAETRFTSNNVSVTNFSVVTEHSYKDKDGNWQSTSNWHNCVAFDLSDWIKKRLRKGTTIYFEGRVSNTTYADKQGAKKYKSEVVVDKRTIIPFERSERGNGEATQTENQTVSESVPSTDGNNDLPF